MFMAAIEGTIVATAMPNIAGSLGNFALYSWVFSAYLLMQAVTTPMFGKLSDLYGRKPVFVIGVLVFLAGSVACGLAPSMEWLIVFRLVQGIGAGAVQPTVSTLAGDLFAFEERARVQGWLSSVWGLSAILGPLAGGLIVENFHWAWIFWINVPFGLVSILVVMLFLHEEIEKRRRSVDYAGLSLFLVGISSLIVLLTQVAALSWPARLGLLAAAVVFLALFWRQEGRAPEPMMPLSLWRDRLVRAANIASMGAGMVMIAVITYVPTYAQGVLGTSALVAGFTLTTMSIGWPIASVAAGKLMVSRGTRFTARAGGLALFTGSAMFTLLNAFPYALYAAASSLMVGVGMGLLMTTFLVAVQTRVDWAQRGAATATNLLMRFLGNALGAALLGGVINASLMNFLRRTGLVEQVALDDVTRLLGEGATFDAELAALVSAGLSDALGLAFLVMAGLGFVTLLVTFTVPELKRES